jgi:hypothetical protein
LGTELPHSRGNPAVGAEPPHRRRNPAIADKLPHSSGNQAIGDRAQKARIMQWIGRVRHGTEPEASHQRSCGGGAVFLQNHQ